MLEREWFPRDPPQIRRVG